MRRLVRGAAFVITVGLGSGGNPAGAYRLYDNGALDYIVGSDQAIRWSAEAWGPGQTLVWQVEDGPDWPLLFDSTQDIVPLAERALAAWSEVPTADISWRMAGVVEPGEGPRFGDSANRVFFDGESGIGGAVIWWVRNHALDSWEIMECDVGIPGYWVDWVDEDADAATRNVPLFLLKEFGHCFGLGRAALPPGSIGLRASAEDSSRQYFTSSAVWLPWPAMSWWRRPDSLSPSSDDRVGASLLRPRTGWPSSVGALSGTLEMEGQPVPYAHVYALRRSGGGEMRHPVGAFANAGGEFLIEGLPPGDYLLWAHPIRFFHQHWPLIEGGGATDMKDTVLMHPVRVEAGAVTGGIAIPMRRGRR